MNSTLNSAASKNHTIDDNQKLKPLFFNYHEFTVTQYTDLDGQLREHDEDQALCITHFPNVYEPIDSDLFSKTRIVRIPRRFDNSLDYPCFSNQLPGSEPAALVSYDEQFKFLPKGEYDGQIFGLSSVSPLSQYLSSKELSDIVDNVNDYLRRGYMTSSWWNILNNLVDTLTFNLWNSILIRVFDNPLSELEDYVHKINDSEPFKAKNLKIISPRRSGYLSVCFKHL